MGEDLDGLKTQVLELENDDAKAVCFMLHL